jgi:predicted methyltransferase
MDDRILKKVYHKLWTCRFETATHRRDDIDQCPSTVKTTLRRLALLLATESLKNQSILLLGDDDLLSVAIAATDIPVHITVIDLDSALLARIKHWTQDREIEILHHDLRQELPSSLFSGFDLIFTDPPYTLAGQLLFLKRAVTAMYPARESSLYLCASRFYLKHEQIDQVVQAAQAAGLQLMKVHEDFNEYPATPDVAEDIRRRIGQGCRSFLHSTLFHFKPKGYHLSPKLIPLPPVNIYDYKQEINYASR